MSTADITNYGAIEGRDDAEAAAANTRALRDAARSAGSGGTIYVPAGTYYAFDDGPNHVYFGGNVPAGVSIVGDGPTESELKLWSGASSSYSDNMFRYDSGTDHGSVEIRDIKIDGNYENVDKGSKNSWAVNALGPGTFEIHNVWFRGLWTLGARFRRNVGDVHIHDCRFEEIAIGVNRETSRSGHGFDVVHPSGSKIVIEDTAFYRIAGSAFDRGEGAAGDIVARNCYCQGIGNSFMKLNEHTSGQNLVEHINYVGQTQWMLDNLHDDGSESDWGRWFLHQINASSGSQIEMYHVQAKQVPREFILSYGSSKMDFTGDMIAFETFQTDSYGDCAIRDGDGINFDVGRISVHDGSDEVFNVSSSSGSISTVRYGDVPGLGDTGGVSCNEEVAGGDTLSPDVPAESDVGLLANTQQSEEEQETSVDDESFQNWTPRWASTEDDWSVVSGSEYSAEHALQFDHPTDDRSRRLLSWDEIGEASDVEVLDRFRVPTFAEGSGYMGNHARSYVRAGNSGGEDGYWIEIDVENQAFRLAKYTNGSLVDLARFGTPEPDTFYFRRLRAEGSTLRAKVWPAGEDEPDGWDAEVKDLDHSSGWVGLGSFDPEVVEFDVFSVATGGATAPMPSESVSTSSSSVAVQTNDATSVGSNSAVLGGELTDMGGADAVDVSFDWRATGADSWSSAGATTLQATGTFETELTGLDAGTEYEFRAVAQGDETVTGGTVTFTTQTADDGGSSETDSASAPVIEQFEVTDRSSDGWTRYDADWSVSDGDADLDTVVTSLCHNGRTVKATSTTVDGDTASYTHVMRVRGPVDEVRISANDVENRVSTESTQV